jgi:hypothetical protein
MSTAGHCCAEVCVTVLLVIWVNLCNINCMDLGSAMLRLGVNHGFVEAAGKGTVFAGRYSRIRAEGNGSLGFETGFNVSLGRPERR